MQYKVSTLLLFNIALDILGPLHFYILESTWQFLEKINPAWSI